MAAQLVTVVRPLTVTTASGNPFIIAPGEQATVEWKGWSPVLKGGIYYLTGTMHNADGRQLRCWDGFEPWVRVDRLHRAVAHTELLYRYCDRCHGTGRDLGRIARSRYDYVNGQAVMPTCPACAATGHAKTYPATA